MAQCPKCEWTSFECETDEVRNYNFKVNLIKCGSCGTVVGIMPYYDPGAVGHETQEMVKKLQSQVNQLAQWVGTLLSRRG
jgi:hypothetical protein